MWLLIAVACDALADWLLRVSVYAWERTDDRA